MYTAQFSSLVISAIAIYCSSFRRLLGHGEGVFTLKLAVKVSYYSRIAHMCTCRGGPVRLNGNNTRSWPVRSAFSRLGDGLGDVGLACAPPQRNSEPLRPSA